tara:strand:- start:5229 stop:5609 length:381 start_codon:yes stop_codon:yes gene_type:complete
VKKLLNISGLSRLLNLINKKDKKPLNHIIRYWEKEFKEIKPKIINNRRYYPEDQVELIKKIKFMLHDKGMTVSGVKKLLKKKINKLDVSNSYSLQEIYLKKKIKEKSKSVLERVNRLKDYGKKISH